MTTIDLSAINSPGTATSERIAEIQADLGTGLDRYTPIKLIAVGDGTFNLVHGQDGELVAALLDASETTIEARVYASRTAAVVGVVNEL